MISAIRKAAKSETIPVRSLPWWFFGLLSPFHETMRELYATRPLWQTLIQLNNAKLVSFGFYATGVCVKRVGYEIEHGQELTPFQCVRVF
jgi:hypothetical protein